ncbi:MAG: PAS domain-containing protein, partial [Anaerolineales bacterium]|nr:PAS domain-containing protein [Anaerolineales bacterium]
MFAGLGIGQYLILLALALLIPVLVILAFRRASRDLPFTPQGDSSFYLPDTSKIHEGILLVQSGGRIEYINGLAREWFGVRPEETPDLERIMRQTRPSGDFLDLC